MAEENQAPDAEAQGTEEESDVTMSYADGKFTNVGDLEKSYLELQSTFSKKLGSFEAAPEEYSFSADGFESNDMADTLSAWGKDNSLSNNGINSLYAKLSELDATRGTAQAEAEASYVKEQTELLGTNAQTRIKNVSDWVNAQGGAGASDKLNLMAAGAEGLEIIENIMKSSHGNTPTSAPAQEYATLEKVNAMQFAKDEYGGFKMDDPKYAAKVRELRASLKR